MKYLRTFFIINIAIQYTVACGSLVQPPDSKSVAGLFSLFLVHIVYKYLCKLYIYCSLLCFIPTAPIYIYSSNFDQKGIVTITIIPTIVICCYDYKITIRNDLSLQISILLAGSL